MEKCQLERVNLFNEESGMLSISQQRLGLSLYGASSLMVDPDSKQVRQ
jgi:hypothetical protein